MLVLGLLSIQEAAGITVVLGEPINPALTTERVSYYPFRRDNYLPGTNSTYQQVYSASDFPMAAMTINQIRFPVAAFGYIDPTAFYLVRLFYSSLPVNGLTMDFDDNLGAGLADAKNPANPLPTGNVVLAGTLPTPSGGFLTFTDLTPAVYNKSNGNLLLDIRQLNGGSSSIGIKATWYTYTADAVFSSVHDYGYGPYANFGLVTYFDGTAHDAIPEPGTMALFGLGVAGLAAAVRRSRKKPARE